MTGPLDPLTAYNSPLTPSPFGLPSIIDNPDFRRQAAFEALTDAGLGLIQASAPSDKPTDWATAFGALAGGAATGARDAQQRYMQRAMFGAQLRNLEMQSAMYPAALKALGGGSDYNPYGAGPPASAPTGAPTPTAPKPAITQTAADESGGNPQAVNPNSGAFGLYQFLPSTWADTAQKHPDLNLPVDMRKATPEQQTAAKAAFDQDNSQGLRMFGIQPTDASLYLAQRFGAKGAATFLTSPDNAPIANVLPSDWIAANPDLQKATVGQFKQAVAQRYGGGFMLANGTPIGAGSGLAPNGGPQPPQGPQVAQAGPAVAPQAAPPGAPPAGVPGLPPMPVTPPDPSKYAGAMMLGGPFAAAAQAKMKAEQLRYEAAQKLYEMSLATRKQQLSEANEPVTVTGQTNQPAINAAAAKTQAQESAKVRGHLEAIMPPGFDKMKPDELRQKMNPLIVATADQLASFQRFPSDLAQRTGQGGPSKDEIIAATKYLHPDYDPNLAEQRKDFMRGYMAPSGDGGKIVMSVANAGQHLADAGEAYNALRNGKWPLANEWFNKIATANGWDKATSFDTIKQAIGTEIAKVVSGGSDNSVTEREANREILENWNNPDQMAGIFQRFGGLIEKRRNTLYDQAARYKLGKEYIDQAIGQHGTEALASLQHAILPLRAVQSLKEGVVTSFGNGQKWTLQGGVPTKVP